MNCEVSQACQKLSSCDLLQCDKPKIAERSLFTSKGITLHSYFNNSSLFQLNPLYKELYNRGYPIESLNSMIKCREESDFIVARCGCGDRVIPLKHHCDLRTCPICSQRRKKRLKKRYFPFLRTCKIDRLNSLYFLTISPKNFTNLEEGIKKIRFDFNKWRRQKYIKERVKSGLFVIECKESDNKTWNVHLHCVVYGRRLDNRIRGHCLDCGQNLLKYDRYSQKFYCSNKNCNSQNLIINKHSRLNRMWLKASGSEAHFDITRLNSVGSTLNYMLKYISSNKEDFRSIGSEAEYICVIRGKRLVSSFGSFYKAKIPKLSDIPCICKKCNQEIEFIYDPLLVFEIQNQNNPPPPPDPIIYLEEKGGVFYRV